MSLTKKYSFHDTFVKTCEFKNGQGDCKKTRESKKCIDNNCEIVRIPMKKKEILNNYYQTQQGGSPSPVNSLTFKCPICNLVLPVEILTRHMKFHNNVDSSNLFQQTFCNVKPINKSFKELFPQYGGRNMVGAGVYKNKYICPKCHKYCYISDMEHHNCL